MTLYNSERLQELNKTVKVYSSVIIAVWVAVAALSVALCCITDPYNAAAFQATLTAAWIIAGWFTLSALYLRIFPAKKTAKFVNYVLNAEKRELCGTVEKIGDTITFANAETVEIVIGSDGAQTVLYLEKAVKTPFSAGDKIKFTAAGNVICGYEAADD